MTGTRTIPWGAAAVIAVAVTTAVVTAAVTSGDRASVVSQNEVLRQPGATDPGSAPGGSSPNAGATARATAGAEPGAAGAEPGAAGDPQVVVSRAGTLVVSCSGGIARLQQWSPNAGYRADDVLQGPAATVSVWFESDRDNDVKVIVKCDQGRALMTEEVEYDDHGGGRSGRG